MQMPPYLQFFHAVIARRCQTVFEALYNVVLSASVAKKHFGSTDHRPKAILSVIKNSISQAKRRLGCDKKIHF